MRKVYAVINIWHDTLVGGYETTIVSPMYTTREEAEKHMYSRGDCDDTIREYEVREKFECLNEKEDK